MGVEVPYFWAVSLFDSCAQAIRVCSASLEHAATAPLQHIAPRPRSRDVEKVQKWPICAHYHGFRANIFKLSWAFEPKVNRFRLLTVMDVLVRQHVEAMDREQLLNRAREVSKALKIYGKPEDCAKKWKNEAEKEAAIRDRLISGMLIEPEVLHMVYVYQELFQKLFRCYAPKGHMTYAEFWQFCADFQLTPQFVTEHQLVKAYEAVECFRILPARPREPLKSKARAPKRKAATPSSRTPSRSSVASLNPEKAEKERSDSTLSVEDFELECDTVFEAPAFMEALCRVAFLFLSFYGSTLQQSSSSYFKIEWLLCHLRRLCGMMEAEGLLEGMAWELVEWTPSAVLQPAPGPGHRKPVKRRSKQQVPRLKPSKATREAAQSLNKQKTLNNVREAAKNLGKAALVVRAMSETQKITVPRKPDDSSSDEEPHTKASLTQDRLQELTTRVAAAYQKPRQPRKVPGAAMSVEELFRVEAGKAAVSEGICQLCEQSGGNPVCRGCSAVDSINLRSHPFARLLYQENPQARLLRPRAKALGARLRPTFQPQLPQLEPLKTLA